MVIVNAVKVENTGKNVVFSILISFYMFSLAIRINSSVAWDR